MAGVKLELEFNKNQLNVFKKIINIFPEIRAQMLGYIGSKGKDILYDKFMRGQELQYNGRFDKRGRDKISYSVGRGAKYVKIKSYPANLFEKGRMLRSGRKEPGKHIIERKFKKTMAGNLNGILNDFDRIYLQRKLDKL